MKRYHLLRLASEAVSAQPTRPATSVMHDSADVRLVVFRLLPPQAVPPHMSRSSVTLVIMRGSGFVSDPAGEHAVETGDVVAYEPGELHGMRAASEPMTVLAAITPRPASR